MKKHLSVLFALTVSALSHADVILPRIIDDHMVLQREQAVPIWGWADAGETVTVQFAGQTKTTEPDESGKWIVRLDPMHASAESRTMKISGDNVIELKDVLVGEVWLAMGQSNMEWSLSHIAKEEHLAALEQKGNDLIRSFRVSEHLQSAYPMDDTFGDWRLVDEMVDAGYRKTSAVAFFFASKLQESLQVPVAFLDVSWGGQRIDLFIPDAGYDAVGLPYRNNMPFDADELRLKLDEQMASIADTIASLEKGMVKPLSEEKIHGWSTNGIYNAMLAPLEPYAAKGTIWYQGESNRGRAQYYEQVKALAIGVAEVFENSAMPLYQVQIAPHAYNRNTDPSVSLLGDTIWAAQYQAADELSNVGIVPIHDTDIDIYNIHPTKKRLVGERLAALALNEQYGQDIASKGPRFAQAELLGSQVIVQFGDVDQGLMTRDGEAPSWFELSADGESFVSAEAELVGDTVVLHAASVATPQFVRMGWADIAIPNLSDGNGWPVFAFSSMPVSHGQ